MGKRKEIVSVLLDFGEQMLLCGAEINRVEDTLNRMGRAYGAVEMNTFVITSSIIITMVYADGNEITQTRRIVETETTDFSVLEALNEISRKCCQDPMSPAMLHSKLKKIDQVSHSRLKEYLGSALAAGSFCMFFGGSVFDAMASVGFAFVICYLQKHFAKFCGNKIVFLYLCSLMIGTAIGLFCDGFSFLHEDKIIVGDIMLLIPGLLITNSVKDMLVGDTMSGVLRFLQSILWTAALAGGFISAIFICGGVK